MTKWNPIIENWEGPRYLVLADAIEKSIRAEELQPGQQMPTHRELASRLNVSVQTVSRAYAEAERRRLVSGEIGRGTFVQLPGSENESGYISDGRDNQFTDFSNIGPLLSEEHSQALAGALSALSNNSKAISRLFAFRPTAGLDVHRKAGATWLQRNNVSVPPDDIIVTNISAHGIWVAMASIGAPGDIVATDALVDHTIITVAAILNLKLRGLDSDDQGIIPESFEDLCRHEQVKLLCITPSYSNPTASVMGEPRREQIAEIARRYDVSIVELDDYGLLMPNRLKPLWCFAPERTYYSTSLVVTGLLTGYLVGPRPSMSRLITRFRSTGWIANTWAAEVASMWLYDGTIEKLVRHAQTHLKSRHKLFELAMAGQDYVSHPYAPHVWLKLPEQWRSRTFVEQAKRRAVLVTPPDPFMVGRTSDPHAIRLAFGNTVPSEQEFKRGIAAVADLLLSDPEPHIEDF